MLSFIFLNILKVTNFSNRNYLKRFFNRLSYQLNLFWLFLLKFFRIEQLLFLPICKALSFLDIEEEENETQESYDSVEEECSGWRQKFYKPFCG